MRLSAIFSLLLVVATGFATFSVKYEVEGLRTRLARLKSDLATDRSQLRVLRAEWNYLNRPDTLAALNERYLSLVPLTAKQQGGAIDDIPMRAADPAVAAASPAKAAPAPAPALARTGPPAAAKAPAVLKLASRGGPNAHPKTIGELIALLSAPR